MFRVTLIVTIIGCIFMMNARHSYGDEQIHPLATGGDWLAVAHSTSMVAAADMCGLANRVAGIIIRADAEGIQFRAANEKWSLPPHVSGEIAIAIGGWTTSFDISFNTNTMVGAEVTSDTTVPLFIAMDTASSMSVTIGKAQPIQVSLKGSTRATNAFRTCTGIKGSAGSPGSNPFE